MCGIAGVYSTRISIEQKRSIVHLMADAMMHRGPDGLRIYADEFVGIAGNRLAIVDRQSEHKLCWDVDPPVVLAFNGEIYNHQILRAQLSSEHSFQTNTDTEVVASSLSKFGIVALNQFVGDFAVVLWDPRARWGFLARDRMGVKPLYYAEFEKGLVFSSEIKPILTAFPELAQMDPVGIYHYLTFRFVPSPNTSFKQIKKLPSGNWLPLAPTFEVPKQYWDIQTANIAIESEDEREVIAAGDELLKQSIRDRLSDEVVVGTLLSGGLDSSLITAIAALSSTKPLKTYSVVYSGTDAVEDYSEHRSSRLLAEMFETDHSELVVSAQKFNEATLKTVWHLEDLIADPPAVLLSILCAEAKNDAKVLLSGDGADELFAGYSLYSLLIDSNENYTGMGRLLVNGEKQSLFSADFLSAVGKIDSFEPSSLNGSRAGWDKLDQMLYIDCKYWLADDLLIKADKIGMMSSLEIRVPYLDHRFVEFAYSLPRSYKLCGRSSKYLLRQIGHRYLPSTFVEQPKRGFPLPLGHWLRGDLREWLCDIFSDLSRRKIFDSIALKGLLTRYFSEPPSILLDHVLWSFVVLELFFVNLERTLKAKNVI